MKARIIREPRCALLWRIDETYPNYAAIPRAAKRYDVKLRAVADGDLGGIVGDLCAGKPAPAFAPLIAVPDRPAIIISGLRHDNGELGAFLDLVKMGGASIPVRSMVTPTSKQCRGTPPARTSGTLRLLPCRMIYRAITNCLISITTTTTL